MMKLLAFAFMVAAGQLLFKRTADGLAEVTGVVAVFREIALDRSFIAAVILYAAATFLWIFALREIPLSRAYPFMALAFVLVPAGAVLLYHETLGLRYFIGLAFILLGIIVISSGEDAQRPTAEVQAMHG